VVAEWAGRSKPDEREWAEALSPVTAGPVVAGDVELWSVELDRGCGDPDGISLLSAPERARAARIRREGDRRRYVASHLWLRRLLAGRLGLELDRIEYRTGEAGKPELSWPASSGLRFSMSRSGGLALYAFGTGREVGVDVEECRSDTDLAALEDRFLSPGEQAALSRLHGPARRDAFYRTWARKEAFLKAVGVGLSVAWDAIDTTGDVVRLERDLGRVNMGQQPWALSDLEVGAPYAAAVSVEGGLGAARLLVRQAGASTDA